MPWGFGRQSRLVRKRPRLLSRLYPYAQNYLVKTAETRVRSGKWPWGTSDAAPLSFREDQL